MHANIQVTYICESKRNKQNLKHFINQVWLKVEAIYFPSGVSGKNLPANAGDVRDMGLIPGSGRSLGRGHGSPL